MDKKTDLTNGGILNKLIFISAPIMATSVMQMLYNLTDMFWLGRLSSDDVAASGAAGMFVWLGLAISALGRTGAEIGVAQNKGRGNEEAAKHYLQNAVFLALALGITYSLTLVIGANGLLSILKIQEAEVFSAAINYLRIVALGIPAAFLTTTLTGAFNGSGHSRVPFYMNSAGLLLNMVLNPLVVFYTNFGIVGVALANMLAQYLVAGLLLWAIKKHKERPFAEVSLLKKPDLQRLKQIVGWGLPVSLESGFFTGLYMLVTRVITSFGSDALAVQRVSTQIESLSWLIGGGFGSAVTAYLGQNLGAERWDRIDKGFRIASLAMIAWGAVVTIILFFGGYALIGLFLRETHLREMGAFYLKLLAIGQIISSLEGVGSGYFRGIGKTVTPSVSSIVSNLIRVPLCWWLSATALGINGVWWAITLTAMLRGGAVYGFALIRQLKNRRHQVQTTA